MSSPLDPAATLRVVSDVWDRSILPALTEYIKIPNRSPAYDARWKANGHMDRAVDLVAGWCRERPLAGMTLEVVRLKNERGEERTPVIVMEIPGDPASKETVLLYGHLDKQPEMTGWEEGLGPWIPVRRG